MEIRMITRYIQVWWFRIEVDHNVALDDSKVFKTGQPISV